MAQNLTCLREIDEEEQGGQEHEESTHEDKQRVSFESLTVLNVSVSSPPPRPRHLPDRSFIHADSTGSINQSRLRISGIMPTLPSFVTRTNSRASDTPSDHQLGRFASGSEVDTPTTAPDTSRVYRRYRVGDACLVSNHQSRFANLVNRYGYPPGEGIAPEEQRGPYVYVLATVTKVHFEEDAEYYTVIRADTGVEQRADDEWMEPLRTARGEAAARRAATESMKGTTNEQDLSQSRETGHSTHGPFVKIATPFIRFFNRFYHIAVTRLLTWLQVAKHVSQKNGRLFLNGTAPYSFTTKLTMVNFLVLCSTWYMFIDQARLAFFPPSADNGVANLNFIVWLILVIELFLEVFIRPEGYQVLMKSDKAYAPSTARFINTFHLCGETISLAFFAPEFYCIFGSSQCSDRLPFSYFNAQFVSVLGPERVNVLYGKLYIAVMRLRVFGLVRHWKNMWIKNTFVEMRSATVTSFLMPTKAPKFERVGESKESLKRKEKEDDGLTNVSNIGTALMVINSHRALILLWFTMGLLPCVRVIKQNGGANLMARNMVAQLQANNLAFTQVGPESCQFYSDTLYAWIMGVSSGSQMTGSKQSSDPYVNGFSPFIMYLWIEPIPCTELYTNSSVDPNESVTSVLCGYFQSQSPSSNQTSETLVDNICKVWGNTTTATTDDELASRAGIRTGAILVESSSEPGFYTLEDGVTRIETNFSVVAKFNEASSISTGAFESFLLQLSLLVCVLGGLAVLRGDAIVLVLGPLRRMLKIVARYAKNPLAPAATAPKGDDSVDDTERDPASHKEDRLGSFETNQLINAIAKIADLLRKCWGVAGADIISTNLATQEGTLTEVFNPTVPGKSVYALFGFAAIDGFSNTVHNLGGDVMILINDVAAVLHGEVFRWGFGDSGQCNKNLGNAFLMVYRIGLVKEVIQKLEEATDVVFSGSSQKQGGARRRRNRARSTATTQSSNLSSASRHRSSKRTTTTNAMSLSLRSLPGIAAFTDRAVIGMLKSYAGIHRDNKLLAWKDDFRLGAGVGAFSVNMIFGMDAGWAVEGAVGSEYKIDATYLSPHVNMASRMMSACKQYGVSILLSQAVQELMSSTACSKLRHLDTVTVKGSTLKQKIYTYDARHKGVDFFLFCRSDEQADLDSERYTPNIWNTDQDLKAMRQHVTEDFEDEFRKGRDAYLFGNWSEATTHLERANEIMVENVMDQGYIDEELDDLKSRIIDGEERAEEELRIETGDGPSRRLIAFMKQNGGKAPEGWRGFRPLTQK